MRWTGSSSTRRPSFEAPHAAIHAKFLPFSMKLILTGSSWRSQQRKVVNPLAGRAVKDKSYPPSAVVGLNPAGASTAGTPEWSAEISTCSFSSSSTVGSVMVAA